jgi:ketosteroid isomerase-like protein
MSEENVEALRRAATAVRKNDPSILDALLAPGVHWKVTATAADLIGTYHGIDEVRGWFARWEQAWEEWDWDHPEMRACGDTVLARMRLWARGRHSGVELETDVWQLWTFRGGKVIYYEDFPTKEQALEAAGLRE